MSRSSAAARNLSLTEELERLEQSITLTLQGTAPFASFAVAFAVALAHRQSRNRP